MENKFEIFLNSNTGDWRLESEMNHWNLSLSVCLSVSFKKGPLRMLDLADFIEEKKKFIISIGREKMSVKGTGKKS